MKRLIIYHANCMDGLVAAWVFHRHLPDGETEYLPAKYGDPPPDVTGKSVRILDFSYPREILLSMKEKASSLYVLDHHESAEKALEGLDFCVFDKEESGASLALQWFFGVSGSSSSYPAVNLIVPYVRDRDLWKHELPGSKEFNAALRSYPPTFEFLDSLLDRDAESLKAQFIEEGKSILRVQDSIVSRRKAQAERKEVALPDGTVSVWHVVNATEYLSEVAGGLAEDTLDTGCCWFEGGNGTRVYSLRSTPAGNPVNTVAELFGGGGHRNAAGFTLPPNSLHPWDMASNRDMPCIGCPALKTCDFKFDSYNYGAVAGIDCLATK